MHRFLNQHLLATAYETLVTDHEKRGWRIVSLAYCQLWFAYPLAQARWGPWEKHLTKKQAPSPVRILSSTHVQRDFQRILGQIGTPARRLKLRGKPRGRAPGQRLKRRPRYKIVRKGHKKAP